MWATWSHGFFSRQKKGPSINKEQHPSVKASARLMNLHSFAENNFRESLLKRLMSFFWEEKVEKMILFTFESMDFLKKDPERVSNISC